MLAKEAFDSVCAQIAERYKEDGWKYSKSSHWMTKKDKDLTYKVCFFTSWYNRSDESVAFYGSFGIFLNKTKRGCFGISTENCNIPEGKLHWNVATEELGKVAVEEFTNWLETVCFPIMDECRSNPNEYVKKVVKEGFFPSHGYDIDIDFVLQFGSRELAEEATKRYYANLGEKEKLNFKLNYESIINGGSAVNHYGESVMRRYSTFRTIIENKIMVDLE